MSKSKPKGILVVSDLHAGSIYGMMPPDFEASDDRIVTQNPGQRYLWECWTDLCNRVSRKNIVAVVVNGDVVDGEQRKQNAAESSLPVLVDQCLAAEACLQALRKRTKSAVWYAIRGTDYHEGPSGREIEAVARGLKCKQYAGLGQGQFCRQVLDLELDGVRINFAHHVGGGNGIYKATAIDREGTFAALATREKIDCIVRSHTHEFVATEYPRRHNIKTPCWQLQTDYARKLSVYRMIPDIGGIIIWVDGEAKKQGEDPIRLEKILYRLPAVVATKL